MNDHSVTAETNAHPSPAVVMVPSQELRSPDSQRKATPEAARPESAEAGESASRLSELLLGLGEAATGDLATIGSLSLSSDSTGVDTDSQAAESRRFENRLAMVRLGMATSLFYALRTKHAPTAAHSLRVALACSAWCERLGLDEEQRDRIEVAGLLHDIGKIGIPDRILRKPGKLTVEEQLSMECCAELGCEILRGCTDDQILLDTIRYGGVWYESRRQNDTMRGDALPLGSRMLSIAGAFDAMTTDQVYRSALSRERALQELYRGCGTQFDPELTRDFTMMLEQRPELLHSSVVDRWLQQLSTTEPSFLGNTDPSASSRATQGSLSKLALPQPTTVGSSDPSVGVAGSAPGPLPFYETLGDHLRDGIAFTDREGQVLYWNDAMSRMTGITSEAAVGRLWDSDDFGLEFKGSDSGDSCPVAESIERKIVVSRSMKIQIQGNKRDVFVQAAPVSEQSGGGCVIMVRDTSDRAEMQNQIQSLHKKATSDPLTGVANRAEFDSRLIHFTTKAQQQGQIFSLIICDIDHFKLVNDVHGHQAGDEALIQFAQVLESHTRNGDLVARYGGEEFVFLAIDSDNATAARRAEQIRQAVASTPLDGLGGESVTVSFGVTEYQTGDAPETVLARADRALMQAKENGRNRVVQLGMGRSETEEEGSSTNWFSWLTSGARSKECEFDLATPVPTDLAVEKLRGFIADHRAEIVHVTGSEVSLRLTASGGTGRRAADQQISLHVLIGLSEAKGKRGSRGASITQTKIHLTVKPIRSRDRRSADLQPCINQVVSSLRSYLMAELIRDEE